MGNTWIKNKSHNKVLVVGIDAAGKTSILYKLMEDREEEVDTRMVVIGCTVDTAQYENMSLVAFDLGYSRTMYPLFTEVIHNAKALIWVVDSNDRERIDGQHGSELSSCSELHYFLNFFRDKLKKVKAILVFANKQDLCSAMSTEEVQDRLQMTQYVKNITPDLLQRIGNDTYLQMLPVHLLEILCVYATETVCSLQGPKIIENDLNHAGMLSCDLLKYDNDDGQLRFRQRNVQRKIQRIICDYLPPYGSWKKSELKQCNIFGCSAIDGDGLQQGLKWLSSVIE